MCGLEIKNGNVYKMEKKITYPNLSGTYDSGGLNVTV